MAELEDVLNDWVASGEGPSAAALNARVRRWPEFADDLVDYAVAWALMRALERRSLRREVRRAAAAHDFAAMARAVACHRWSAPPVRLPRR